MKHIKYNWGKDIQFSFELLTKENFSYTKNFRCGNSEINSFLQKQDKCFNTDKGVTYIFRDVIDNQILAFVVLCCSGIKYEYQNVAVTLPAIEIKYFALASCVQRIPFSQEDIISNEHYYFSDYLLGMIMYKCSEISQTVLGAQYILLYAVPRGTKLYSRVGFVDFTEYMIQDNIRYLNGCKPMYIEIT